ncbi:MAG: low temperature requirement protein A [Streptosporangiaceae bacterium]
MPYLVRDPAPGVYDDIARQLHMRTLSMVVFFVFVVTQLTGVLVGRLTPLGLVQVVLQFGVLWWMYAGYAWLTNMLAPTTTGRRFLLLTGMGGFLLIGLATPTAFDGGGVAWGVGYLILVGAHAVLFAQGNPHILKVLPGNALAAVLIIVAGLLDGPAVYLLWTLALGIPILMPYVVPVGGRFLIQAEHIVERHSLLVLITFGESIIAIGIGAQGHELTFGLAVAALLGLATVGGLWWTYFDRDDQRTEHALAAADEAVRAQRTMTGYFYAHLPIIIGVIVFAAGLKKVLGHAWGHLSTGQALALAGGVALYLLGDVLFRAVMGLGPSRIRLGAAVLSLVTIPVGLFVATLQLTALLAVVAGALVLETRTRSTLG